MQEKFIHNHEFIRMVNQSLKEIGLPQIVDAELIKQLLLQKGWIDKDGNITEEWIKSGMLKMGPHVDLN